MRLISFALCPFVQRSVIVLREKGLACEITYIDLEQPPEWFKAISPLGKVPLLQVGEEVLFESAVIMEYLDEISPPSLHPRDPLRKAHHRAWFEFASNLLVGQYRMMMAADEATFVAQQAQLRSDLVRLESQVQGPWFAGDTFHLVDAAFAPFFTRNRLLENWSPLALLEGLDKVAAWQARLLARPAVQHSVVDDLEPRLRAYVTRHGGHAAQRFG